VLAARDAYNEAAARHGFTRVTENGFTPQIAKRLQKRLDDIGGLEAWRRALSVIHLDDWLMGRVPPKDGWAPFKLDIDKLLSTNSGMGDVLAKLLDRAGDAANGRSGAGPDLLAVLKQNPDSAKHLTDDDLRKALKDTPPDQWALFIPAHRLPAITGGSQ
jgi:hypothetical protein